MNSGSCFAHNSYANSQIRVFFCRSLSGDLRLENRITHIKHKCEIIFKIRDKKDNKIASPHAVVMNDGCT